MIHCNNGNSRVTKEATLKRFRTVWFDECKVFNILSFRRIREKHPVCYDTNGNYCSMIKTDKHILFRKIPSGLYFHNNSDWGVVLINIVRKAGRNSPRYNMMAPSKRDVHWTWWVSHQRKTLKIWCILEWYTIDQSHLMTSKNDNTLFFPQLPLTKRENGEAATQACGLELY